MRVCACVCLFVCVFAKQNLTKVLNSGEYDFGWDYDVNTLKVTGKEISHFDVNITLQTIILFPIRCTTTIKTILTNSYHIYIKIFLKFLISELS